MTKLQEIVARFRDELAAHRSRFLLVYTEENVIGGTVDCRATSNSDRTGVRAIMSFLMRSTPEAIALLARALEEAALSGADVSPAAIRLAAAEGAFSEAAITLFDKLRGLLTIAGWEQPTPNESSPS
jgi:hypothetical protein